MNPDKTLADILAWRMRIREPMPVGLVLAILRQVCDSLEYAHNLCDPTGRPLGIVHRDVSPSNIVISESGTATLVGSNAPQGAFAYAAPELIATGALDARADLFALGAVAHEMLANQPLFAGRDDRDTLDRVWGLPIPPPSAVNPQISPELDGIVLMALARDPAYRWQHAAMFRDGLLAVAQRLGIPLPPANDTTWRALFAEPAPEPAAPAPPPPPDDAPPSDPELWADDTNLETRVQPADERILKLAQDAAAQPPARPSAPAPRPPSELTLQPPARPSAPAPQELTLQPPMRPSAATPPPQPVVRPSGPMPRPSGPMAPPPQVAPPPQPEPEPEPPPPAYEEPPPPVRPVHGFDVELGPEPTQIGAMPLISFGNTPLVSLVGESAPRVSTHELPPPVATFMPEAPSVEDADARRLNKLAIITAVALVAIVAVVMIATH